MAELIKRISEILRIPASFRSAANQSSRIPKTVLFKNSRLEQTDRSLLDKSVEELHVFGIANPSTNVPAFVSDERNYSEMLFVFCKLKEMKNPRKVILSAQLLIDAFDKPVLLFLSDRLEDTAKTRMMLAAGRKRFNLNDPTQQLTESFSHSHALNLGSPSDQAYLEAISIPNMSLINLYELHERLYDTLVSVDERLSKRLDGWLAKKPKKIEDLAEFVAIARTYGESLSLMDNLEKEHHEARSSGEFGQGLSIHVHQKEKQKELDKLFEKLKRTFA